MTLKQTQTRLEQVRYTVEVILRPYISIRGRSATSRFPNIPAQISH